MKFIYMEIEATAEELKSEPTIADAIKDKLLWALAQSSGLHTTPTTDDLEDDLK